MKKILIFIWICIFALFGIIQVHEYQHYQDFKDLGCTNIEYKVFSVETYCPNVEIAQAFSEYRDYQVIRLWI